MTAMLDVGRYLDRIEWGGSTVPTLDSLTGLVAAHTARIPFENLDVLLARPVRLDLEALQDKLVRRRRGGYCFEHATLMGAALDALGFDVVRHAARVVMYVPRNAAPRTHMLLVVRLGEGEFVVDPGFGALAPRVPVPLSGGVAQFGAERRWLARDGDHWTLRARVADYDVDCWTTPLDDVHPIDFEMANHFTATHASSPFVNRLMLRAFTPDGRVTAMNREVTITRGSESTTSALADRSALRALLVEHFGFDLPEVETMRVPAVDGWQ